MSRYVFTICTLLSSIPSFSKNPSTPNSENKRLREIHTSINRAIREADNNRVQIAKELKTDSESAFKKYPGLAYGFILHHSDGVGIDLRTEEGLKKLYKNSLAQHDYNLDECFPLSGPKFIPLPKCVKLIGTHCVLFGGVDGKLYGVRVKKRMETEKIQPLGFDDWMKLRNKEHFFLRMIREANIGEMLMRSYF